jgi:hypothetical protein
MCASGSLHCATSHGEGTGICVFENNCDVCVRLLTKILCKNIQIILVIPKFENLFILHSISESLLIFNQALLMLDSNFDLSTKYLE